MPFAAPDANENIVKQINVEEILIEKNKHIDAVRRCHDLQGNSSALLESSTVSSLTNNDTLFKIDDISVKKDQTVYDLETTTERHSQLICAVSESTETSEGDKICMGKPATDMPSQLDLPLSINATKSQEQRKDLEKETQILCPKSIIIETHGECKESDYETLNHTFLPMTETAALMSSIFTDETNMKTVLNLRTPSLDTSAKLKDDIRTEFEEVNLDVQEKKIEKLHRADTVETTKIVCDNIHTEEETKLVISTIDVGQIEKNVQDEDSGRLLNDTDLNSDDSNETEANPYFGYGLPIGVCVGFTLGVAVLAMIKNK